MIRYDGAVLAGGRSSRMGTDKAFLPLDDGVLLDRPLAALSGAERRLLVGVDADRFAMLDRAGWTAIADDEPGEGPLGGVLTAMRAADHDICVMLACDLPHITSTAVEHLVASLGSADVAVPIVGGRAQWVAAAWHRRSLPRLVAAWEAGERSIRRAVGPRRVVHVLHADARAFVDVDTPGDLLTIEPGSGTPSPAR
ncbi:MAG: molybdenum cofactor guanylyltransferase [Acidimicrobiales bacterium]